MNCRIPTLTMTGLTTGYRSKKNDYIVGRELSASLYSGELTCLIGTNGCGKSTLLRTLTAFLPSLKGKIVVRNRDLSDYSRDELSRLIGVVLTDKVDVRDLKVRDLVAMGRMPYTGFWGHLTEQDHILVDEAIRLVGICMLRNRPIHSLSDGELQKVLIAKTLAQETPFIFLDEPTAFLDYPSKVELFLLLRRLAREKQKTVFLSTHDLDLVLQMADRLWLLSQEQGLLTGIPEDLVAQGKLGDFFSHPHLLFSPEHMNFQVKTDVPGNGVKVKIEGVEGVARTLLCRALSRYGIMTGDSSAAISVFVQNTADMPCYTLMKKTDILLKTDSIEELLQSISVSISVPE